MMFLLILIVSALLAGWLGGLVTRGNGFGVAGNMLAAFAGATIGVQLLRAVGPDIMQSPVWMAAIALASAFLLLAIIGEMRR